MSNLNEYMRDCAGRPFEYGKHDCLTFALAYFDRFYNKGLVARLPQYDSHRTGLQALAHLGMTYEEYLDDLVKEVGMVRNSVRWCENLVLAHERRLCPDGPVTGLRLDSGAVAYLTQADGIRVELEEHNILVEWSV